ncbi:hypothetical protein FIBSPDRAFT_851367, partial [Athelia psychrophila]
TGRAGLEGRLREIVLLSTCCQLRQLSSFKLQDSIGGQTPETFNAQRSNFNAPTCAAREPAPRCPPCFPSQSQFGGCSQGAARISL